VLFVSLVATLVLALGVTALAQRRQDPSPAPGDASDPGVVAPSDAAADLRDVDPNALKPSQALGQGIDPSLGQGIDPSVDRGAGGLVLDGSLASGAINRDPEGGFFVGTDAGRLQASPVGVGAQASSAALVAGGDAALFANTAPSTDTLVRPDPTGVETYTQFRDDSAPTTTSWRISLPGDETLMLLPKGGLAVLAPTDETDNRSSTSPSVPPAGADGGGSGEDTTGGAPSSAIPAGTRIIAVMTAPGAIDANGTSVDATLSVKGDTVTMKIAPTASTAYPVVADPAFIPSGTLGGGWWGYGASESLYRSRYSFENRPTQDGGCGFYDEGGVDTGESEVVRQIAVRGHSCLSLVETGLPYAEPGEDVDITDDLNDNGDDGSGPAAHAATAAAKIHKNRGYYKSDQEDMAQIDVNSVSDTVIWTYTSSCVRSAKGFDHTGVFKLTGWHRIGFNSLDTTRTCGEATKSTYADFKGGQYFPACFGGSVYTFYSNNIAQGRPAGRFTPKSYQVSGGALCHYLLHFEHHKKNKRIY
jgi:hypothetical protein